MWRAGAAGLRPSLLFGGRSTGRHFPRLGDHELGTSCARAVHELGASCGGLPASSGEGQQGGGTLHEGEGAGVRGVGAGIGGMGARVLRVDAAAWVIGHARRASILRDPRASGGMRS